MTSPRPATSRNWPWALLQAPEVGIRKCGLARIAMSEVRRCWYLGAASAPVIMGRAQRQHVHVLEAAHHGLADLGHVGLPSRAPTFQIWRRVPAKPHEAPNLMSAPLRLSKAMAFSFTPLRPSEAPRLSVLPRCVAPLRPGDSVLPHCGAQCSPLRPAEAPPLSVAPPRPGEAVHLSIVPLRPAEAPHLSVAPRPGEAFQCCSAAAPSVAPLRPAEAAHLSSAPLRPGEAFQCCSAAAGDSVSPRCGLAKRCISA